MISQGDSFSGSQMFDGYFELLYKPDGVYIIVHPPRGKGKRVVVADVLNRLAKKQIRDIDRYTLEQAVAKANEITEKIAGPQDEVKIDASLAVGISPDKMMASIIISPPDGGRMLTQEEIIKEINESGVVFGINLETINSLCRNPVFNKQIQIAEGIAPTNGTNGKLIYHFETHRDAKPTIMEDGRVNFRELNIIENVKRGQVLVTTTLPTPGKPGRNVLGLDIPALDGKPAALPRGKHVEITEDGQALTASIDGMVNYIDGKVNVFSLYEVQADVDNSTGNINFIGNVLIHGNVLSGFTVEAGGTVEVWGVVEGATIRAGGSIILRTGMQGLGKGLLVSERDIVAKYIEHSNIQAKGDIRAEAIMHSNVKCGNRLELSGKKGLLVGGTAKVGKEVIVKVIGSPMSTLTEIEVGVDPALRDRYKAAKEEIKNAESDKKKAEQVIELLRKLQQVSKLPPDKQDMLDKSIRTRDHYITRLAELKEEVANLEEVLEEESNGKIVAQSMIYPGTKVAIGSCMMNVRETLQYCTLYRDGADIRVGAYNM